MSRWFNPRLYRRLAIHSSEQRAKRCARGEHPREGHVRKDDGSLVCAFCGQAVAEVER